MKFSKFQSCFDENSGILQLMHDLGNAMDEDKEICMLGGGNPATVPEMQAQFRSEMLAIMDDGSTFEEMIGNYDTPQGNSQFCRALAESFNKEYGWPITKDNIAITNGSQASFGILFNLLSGNYSTGKRKKILLPLTPEYIGYSDVSLANDPIFTARRPEITINQDDPFFYKYNVDFDQLDVNETHGAICISRPTNPTGNIITDCELEKLSNLAKENNIPMILDGAYGLPFPSMVNVQASPIWHQHIILCLSLSKLGLPGVRTGIVIADNKLIRLLKSANAISNLAPGRFGPTLMTRLIKQNALIPLCQKYIQPYYSNKASKAVNYLRQTFKNRPLRIHQPEGAMFLWLWFENLPISCQKLYEKLKERGVYVIAGQHFYPGLKEDWKHKHECIRVSYAAEDTKLMQGLRIISEVIHELYNNKTK